MSRPRRGSTTADKIAKLRQYGERLKVRPYLLKAAPRWSRKAENKKAQVRKMTCPFCACEHAVTLNAINSSGIRCYCSALFLQGNAYYVTPIPIIEGDNTDG